MPLRWTLVNPVAARRDRDLATSERPAGTLRVVGLFSNNKQNCTEIQASIGAWLRERYGVEIRTYRKLNASAPAEPSLIDQIVQDCDAVITGSGDCGSCTAGTVHDSDAIRRRGRPVAMLTSSSFVGLARMQASALGVSELDLLVVSHPIGGITEEELAVRRDEAVAATEPWWQRTAATTAIAS